MIISYGAYLLLSPLVVLPIIKSIAEGTNLHIYREAEGILVDHLFEKMLEKAVKENKKSIIFVSGAAGSGKSTSVKNNKKFINLANEGLVFDSAFNRYEGLAERIEQANKNYQKLVEHFGKENVLFANSNDDKFILRVKKPTLISKSSTSPTTQTNASQPKTNNGPTTVEYTPVGKQRQVYTIQNINGNYHIYNKEGKEVFKTNSKDRTKILTNLAIQEGRATVVQHKNAKYVVNKNGEMQKVLS